MDWPPTMPSEDGESSTRAAGPGTAWNSTDVESTKGRVPGTTALRRTGNFPTELATSRRFSGRMVPSPDPPMSWTHTTASGIALPSAPIARTESCIESPAVMVRVAGCTSMRATGEAGIVVGCWSASASAARTNTEAPFGS